MSALRLLWTVPLGAMLWACSDASDLDRFRAPGPYPVGNATVQAVDGVTGRELTIELWYPASEDARALADTGHPVAEFVSDPARRLQYQELLDSAPADCPGVRTRSARDAEPAAGGDAGWPLILFSHCHECVRFSSFTIAEHLASHGFVVAAPDHADNTLFDGLDGDGVALSEEFLRVRAGDMSFVLDLLLDGAAQVVPTALRGRIDGDQIGVLGHSFGAVTAGLVVQDDARVRAALAIASPMENAFLPGVRMSEIDKPVGFLVAVEDNSITEIGNRFIRNNFEAANMPVWKAEVADTGHWSFSDVAGLHEPFAPGCGSALRQTDGTEFEYLPVATANAIARAYISAFFAGHMRGESSGRLFLASPHDWPQVYTEVRQE